MLRVYIGQRHYNYCFMQDDNLFPRFSNKPQKLTPDRIRKIGKGIFSTLLIIFFAIFLAIPWIGFSLDFGFSYQCSEEEEFIDSEAAKLVLRDEFGNLYVVGSTNSPDFPLLTKNYDFIDSYNRYYYLAKFSFDGIMEWSYFIDDPDIQSISKIILDSSNNLILLGSKLSTAASPNSGMLIKISTSGEIQWVFGFRDGMDTNFILGKNNGVYLVNTYSDADGENTLSDVNINYFSDSGELIWEKNVVGSELYSIAGLYVDTSNNLLMFIRQETIVDQDKIYFTILFKISPVGIILSENQIGIFPVDGNIEKFLWDSAGNFYILGDTRGIVTEMQNPINPKVDGRNIFIIKFDGLNEQIWSTYLRGNYDVSLGKSLLLSNNQLLVTSFAQISDIPMTLNNGGLDLHQFSIDGIMLQTIDIADVLSRDSFLYPESSYVRFTDEKVAFINNIKSENNKENDIQIVTINLVNQETSLINLGGSNEDIYHNAVSDGQGSIIIVGETYSSDFPVLSPQDTDIQASVDSFIIQVDQSLNIDWVTKFGGNGSILTQTWCS